MNRTLCAVLLCLLPATALADRPDGWYTAHARSEARACITAAKEPGWDVVDSVHTVSSCLAGGFITQVDFFKTVTCTPNQPCPRVAAFQVASVQFGCDDAVISIDCPLLGTCDYGDATYFPGDSFPADDGCNTCSCGDSGLIACTKMACVQEPACVVTGCSGQLCVEAELGDQITTCEVRPEYACLADTTCGNFGPGGSCGWDDTPEYLECLDTLEPTGPVAL